MPGAAVCPSIKQISERYPIVPESRYMIKRYLRVHFASSYPDQPATGELSVAVLGAAPGGTGNLLFLGWQVKTRPA